MIRFRKFLQDLNRHVATDPVVQGLRQNRVPVRKDFKGTDRHDRIADTNAPLLDLFIAFRSDVHVHLPDGVHFFPLLRRQDMGGLEPITPVKVRFSVTTDTRWDRSTYYQPPSVANRRYPSFVISFTINPTSSNMARQQDAGRGGGSLLFPEDAADVIRHYLGGRSASIPAA